MAKKKAAQSILWPSGGFDWTPEHIQRLPTVRNIRARTLRPYCKTPITFNDDEYGFVAKELAQINTELGTNWQPCDSATPKSLTSEAALTSSNEAQWTELFAKVMLHHIYLGDEEIDYPDAEWAVQACAATKGLVFAIKPIIDLYAAGYAKIDPKEYAYRFPRAYQYTDPLREAIAICDDVVHKQVMNVLELHSDTSIPLRRFRALIAPHRSDWVAQSYEEEKEVLGNRGFLSSIIPADKMLTIAKRFTGKKESAVWGTTVLLQIRLHGEDAFDLLEHEMQQPYIKHQSQGTAEMIVCMRSPRSIEILAKCIDNNEAKQALESQAKHYPAAVLKCMIEILQQSSSPIAHAWTLRFANNYPDDFELAMQAVNEDAANYMRQLKNELDIPIAAASCVPKGLHALNTKALPLPDFYVAAILSKPILKKSKKALPPETIDVIGSVLQSNKPNQMDKVIKTLKSECTEDSLAAYSWSLFGAWMSANAPNKQNWALNTLGYFGNAETADKIAPLIRLWPGVSQHKRAVVGLDILANIGTDSALMQLNSIATKIKFKALRERANEKISEIAATRGLSADQLADRLAPEMDLDESGRLTIDFGPSQFYIVFDESLKPIVFDTDNTRLKDLPKPRKTDDQDLTNTAVKRFKQLKKDVRAVATVQLLRLERAMSCSRRWTLAEAKEFFIEQPLLCHLSDRLVWGIYDKNNDLAGAFRVAEDRTFTNSTDETVELNEESTVGIVHPVELDDKIKMQFAELFASYDILQPFPQLGRDILTLTKEELKSKLCNQFAGKKVSSGAVMGLMKKGWARDSIGDAGVYTGLVFDIAPDFKAEVSFEPGILIGDPSFEPVQTISKLTFKYKKVQSLFISEVLRDITDLNSVTEK